ncbi:hypothetical protein GWG54_16180 [Natronococcus sp. JC468]|uniref:DUF7835 family putative zinc beta-ribbon protein n=1 Tax=Natronococcus sp. JC468 TaxID=1961921 RepID=UPI0014399570|nr:hypothetical protein [Natronococcus sp. JC468]NKE37326.1 hypothetical protein [Natronococcus sp. JC468]
MVTPEDRFDRVREYCTQCDLDTQHRVSIQIRPESERGTNRAFSREPYRLSECQQCGTQERQRMNQA